MNPDQFSVKWADFFGVTPSFEDCTDWSFDPRTREENMDWTYSRGKIHADRGSRLKNSRLGITVTSRVGRNWACAAQLRWVHFNSIKMANCPQFTDYIIYSPLALKGHSELHLVIFLRGRIDTVAELYAFVFVSVPWNVLLAVSAFIA